MIDSAPVCTRAQHGVARKGPLSMLLGTAGSVCNSGVALAYSCDGCLSRKPSVLHPSTTDMGGRERMAMIFSAAASAEDILAWRIERASLIAPLFFLSRPLCVLGCGRSGGAWLESVMCCVLPHGVACAIVCSQMHDTAATEMGHALSTLFFTQ